MSRAVRRWTWCAVLLAIPASLSTGPAAEASPPPSHERCLDLHRLWARYEWHFTLHSGQKARADLALERDCADGRYAHGLDELQRLLRRGLIPMSWSGN